MSAHIVTTDLEAHPAFQAWAALGLDHPAPDHIQRLGRKRKSTVFRIMSGGAGGAAVVGKRCLRESATVERTIYGEILPQLPVSALRYYGFVEEPDSEFCWLFIEDAGDKDQRPRLEEHGALIARWLGTLHASAVQVAAAVRLPTRGPDHYFDYLQAGREMILQNLGNPLLRPEDLTILKLIVSQCDFIEARRNQIESFCESMPRTLVHGDFVLKNMRLGTRTEGAVLLLYDWETSGWGVPAADLAELLANPQSSADLALYSSIVKDAWPHLDAQDVQQLAAWGRVFRLLAMISWESLQLPYEGVRTAMGSMKYYQNEMAQALQDQGWPEH